MAFLKIAGMAAALMGLTMTAPALAAPEIGKPAPDFTGTDSNGKTIKLSDFKGKIVVLEWTNDGCPYVQKHYSSNNMQTLQKYAAQKGMIWLTIVSSAPGKQGYLTPEEANSLTSERGAAPTAVILDPDGKIGRLYDARTTPHMFIVNADGTLAYMGGIDDKPTANAADIKTARNYVREALDSLAAGRKVEHAVTRPYGCSVKYSS